MLTPEQIEWAKQHDWYVCRNIEQEGEIIVRVVTRNPDGTVNMSWECFSCFDKLKEWAGY